MTRYRDSNANGANNPCLHFESRVEERNFLSERRLGRGERRLEVTPKLRATARWFSRKGGKNCRRWRKKTRFSYLQDTVISTLVAGIEALTGSKSPVDAMFAKVLLILTEWGVGGICNFPFDCRFRRGPAPFHERRGGRSAELVCTPPRQEVEQRCEGEGERQGDVMSLLSFCSSESMCVCEWVPPLPLVPLVLHNISSFTQLPLPPAPLLLPSILIHSACLKSSSKLVEPSLRI